jgi:adenylosuccinate lyase
MIEKNLETYGPFASTERLLMALGKKGANRQEMHEIIRKHAMEAWETIQNNQENPLIELIINENEFLDFLDKDEILSCFEIMTHVGDAPKRAKELAQQILTTLKN